MDLPKITSNRIIAWASNTDIILQDSDKIYKDKVFLSLIKQTNFLVKNLSNVAIGPSKIICCSAIILSGIIFKENDVYYKNGIKELEKIINIYFDDFGFPKSRNPEEVFTCIKYLICGNPSRTVANTPVPTKAMTIKGIFRILGKLQTLSKSSTPNAYNIKPTIAKNIIPDCFLSMLMPNVYSL